MKKWVFAGVYLGGVILLVLPDILGISRRTEPVSADGGILQMDKDGDGRVTFEEALLMQTDLTKDQFDSRDANRDGVWTREDSYSPRLLVGRPPFQRMDRDADGQVTFEEYAASSQEEYNRMDQNADGILTPDEWPRMRRFGGGGYPPEMPFAWPPSRPPEPEWLANQPSLPSATP